VSARIEKARRRAARTEQGISRAAEREQEAFAALVAARRAERAARASAPVVRRDARRRTLAVVGLVIVALILLAFGVGGPR
jgi:3'-phosphoadenosine 5'-phosphosulfate sulfotransferase (PAPS reductase)/FAD synthetase